MEMVVRILLSLAIIISILKVWEMNSDESEDLLQAERWRAVRHESRIQQPQLISSPEAFFLHNFTTYIHGASPSTLRSAITSQARRLTVRIRHQLLAPIIRLCQQSVPCPLTNGCAQFTIFDCTMYRSRRTITLSLSFFVLSIWSLISCHTRISSSILSWSRLVRVQR